MDKNEYILEQIKQINKRLNDLSYLLLESPKISRRDGARALNSNLIRQIARHIIKYTLSDNGLFKRYKKHWSRELRAFLVTLRDEISSSKNKNDIRVNYGPNFSDRQIVSSVNKFIGRANIDIAAEYREQKLVDGYFIDDPFEYGRIGNPKNFSGDTIDEYLISLESYTHLKKGYQLRLIHDGEVIVDTGE